MVNGLVIIGALRIEVEDIVENLIAEHLEVEKVLYRDGEPR